MTVRLQETWPEGGCSKLVTICKKEIAESCGGSALGVGSVVESCVQIGADAWSWDRLVGERGWDQPLEFWDSGSAY